PFKDSISFTYLNSNKTNQTFIGVKLGDVNYDWNANVAKQSTDKTIQLTANIEAKVTNGELRISITVKNFKEIVAMQYTLHFDNTKYEFVNLEGFKNLQGFDYNATQTNTKGNIAMLWTHKNAEAKTLEDGTELFTLVLRSTEISKPITSLELAITNDIAEIEAWDKDFNQHKIILTKQVATTNNLPLTTSQWSVSPNPTSGEIKVSIVSKNNKTVSFELTDAQGKTILKQSVELQKGNNNFTINLKKNGNLTTGIYFLKAIGVEGENVKRIMVK
ncbi:MAG: T9SS type A sorting domain-containing protein, partial [Bacteroidetes bacterium]|nr:T9SS type A sorting domain-containing protein [Bacteroidota bacterium]